MRILLVFALTWLIACRGEPDAKRQTLALKALDDGTAIVVWHEHSRQQWISALGADGRARWSAKLQGNPATYLRSDESLVVGSDRIAVRTHRRDNVVQIETFSLRDGSRTVVPLGPLPNGNDLDLMRGYVVNGELNESFLAFDDNHRHQWLVTIDLRTGNEVRRVPLPFEVKNAVIRTHDVVLQGLYKDVFASASGELRAAGDRGCVLDDRHWRLVKTSGDRYDLTTTEAPSHRLPLELGPGHLWLEHCAQHRDRFILLLAVNRPNKEYSEELWILGRDGSAISHFPVERSDGLMAPTLPRFVPLVVGAPTTTLVMLDVEQGSIAWQLPMTSFESLTLLRSQDRWYLANGIGVLEVAVIDGTTGRLVTAKRLEAEHGIRQLGPNSISQQGLWVRSAQWWETTSSIAKLEPVTLAHVAGAPVTVTNLGQKSPFLGIPRN